MKEIEVKEIFKRTMRTFIKRPGIEGLIEWLETTDFFAAPASTKYHGAHPEGLINHSMNVFNRMMRKHLDFPEGTRMETVAIISLLHDVCKANFYRPQITINPEGQQETKYGYDNKLPIGHGEKSVILIQKHMYLTYEEIIAISWHMGAFDDRVKGGSRELSQAWERHPLALLLHLADMEATWLDERRTGDVPEEQ